MRHLTKDEIIRNMKMSKLQEKSSYRSPFTAMSIIFNLALHESARYGGNKLSEFNMKVNDYYYNDDFDEEEISKRILNKLGWSIVFAPIDISEYRLTGNKFQDALTRKKFESDNRINLESKKYMLIAFASMIDMGLTPKKIETIKNKVAKLLNESTAEDSERRIMDMHQQLFDKTGVYIEKPTL